jgi:hypothetical protein
MKFLLAILLTLLAPFTCPAQDFQKEGALSANLKLAIAYHPKDRNDVEHFEITLTNVSGKDLELEVSDKEYRGTIVVVLKGEKPVEFREKEVRRKMMIGILPASFADLPKDGKIIWKVPVADLRDVEDRSVKTEALHDASVHAVLNRLAVIPPKGGTPVNARQTSPAVVVSRQ